ncbi:MAG: amino acid adenylation domain-containing protein, partial [Planctomycetes bacterium]|nr:amino acid adenylation domain-containing protein [Planctomycetota bacterium]
LPFEKLVEVLQPDRDMSHAPLVQVLFNLANAPFDSPPIQGMAWSPLEVERGAAQFDLTVFADLEITGKIFAEYDIDLFEAGTVDRMLKQFGTALAAVLENPDLRLSEIPLLDEEDRDRLIREWNDYWEDYPREVCFPQLFEAQVVKTPQRCAVTCNGREITYRELNREANRVAALLKRLGAGPGVFVGLYMHRSIDLLTALLGIIKTGAAYLPLDPGFPEDRLAYMVQDAEAPVLVTESHLEDGLPGFKGKRLVIDRERDLIAAQSDENPLPAAAPEDRAYVIYTSGSTGKPKGVQIPHGALVNFLCSMAREPGIDLEDRLLALTTLSFDIAGLELFLPLLKGACVALVDRETAYDAVKLLQKMAEVDATIMQATPATWRMLLDAGWSGKSDLKVLCGGEALSRELADTLLARSRSVYNLYGPTETTVWSALWKVEPGPGTVLIGRPIANTEIFLLDEHLEPVPVGVPGELCIGGHGLAVGYLHRPELTAEKFIPHPFSRETGARIYKTGDLARYLPDGRIECLGRLDHQVKVRGFRIELGEIEAALAGHEKVKRCVVVAREDRPGDKRLVAYIVPEGDQAPGLVELRPHLKKSLPDYMVPAAVVLMETLPLTPNGKIDRRALPAPASEETGTARIYTAPRTPVEEKIARIWAEVLGLDQVDIYEDFFDLGGHSLLATQLAARIREAFEIDLPLRSIFLESSVAGLASKIVYSAKRKAYHYCEESPDWDSLVSIQPKGTRPPFFMVSGTYSEEDAFLGYLANLIPHIGTDQPVYGFKPRGLDGTEIPHGSVEEMAWDYLKEMRAFQPEGPYYLGGECVGGVVAFEMARQ